MRIIIFFLFIISTSYSYSQIVYVDNFDAVYLLPPSAKTIDFDLNNDNYLDLRLSYLYTPTSLECNGIGGAAIITCSFKAVQNSFGQNKLNGPIIFSEIGFDATSDTLDINDLWNNESRVFKGYTFPNAICQNIGYGKHKQGFRLIKTNPQSGALGYIYGYIDYTLTNTGDLIIHGWYYENSFNVPIVANSMLDYPYDGNCIHIDTVKVYDTITTFVAVADTLKINLSIPNSNGDISINTLKVYPNPASTHLFIDMGTHTLLNNYDIQIFNQFGQSVYFSPIDKKEYFLDLNTFGGKGIYFLRIRNQLGVTIDTKKIVLQ